MKTLNRLDRTVTLVNFSQVIRDILTDHPDWENSQVRTHIVRTYNRVVSVSLIQKQRKKLPGLLAAKKRKEEEELTWLKQEVRRNHRRWVMDNPEATLADLRDYLEEVYDELASLDPDELLADADPPDLGADYLAQWGQPDDEATVEYRLENVMADLDAVSYLIDRLGEGFPVNRLPHS